MLSLISMLPFILTNNGFYSDDYQNFYGISIFNNINNSYTSLFDLFQLRSDGHFAPIHYFLNQYFPLNPSYFKCIVWSMHALSLIFIYKTIYILYSRSVALYTVFFLRYKLQFAYQSNCMVNILFTYS